MNSLNDDLTEAPSKLGEAPRDAAAVRFEFVTEPGPRLEALIPLMNEGFVDIYRRFSYQDTPATRANLLGVAERHLTEPEGLLGVYHRDGILAGFCLTGPRRNEITGFSCPCIYGLWVGRGHRGDAANVARLVRNVLDRLKGRGFTMTAAQINLKNPLLPVVERLFRTSRDSAIITIEH